MKNLLKIKVQRNFLSDLRDELFSKVIKYFYQLQNEFNPIVIEGTDRISEINLRSKDIVNMRFALENQADVYLISDIEKGGVFASVYGTFELLTPEERELLKGIIINKFHGDTSLFEEGKEIL